MLVFQEKKLFFFKEDKAKLVSKYKIGDIIKDAEVKGFSNFGCFFNVNGELDVLVHLQELSWTRVDHPDQVLEIGQKSDLKIISIDLEKLQIGCSIKQLSKDPFEHIDNYELNKTYKVKIIKLTDFGAFCELSQVLRLCCTALKFHGQKKMYLQKNYLK